MEAEENETQTITAGFESLGWVRIQARNEPLAFWLLCSLAVKFSKKGIHWTDWDGDGDALGTCSSWQMVGIFNFLRCTATATFELIHYRDIGIDISNATLIIPCSRLGR